MYYPKSQYLADWWALKDLVTAKFALSSSRIMARKRLKSKLKKKSKV